METAAEASSAQDLCQLTAQSYVLRRENIPKDKINLKKGIHGNPEWICLLCVRGFKDEKSALVHVTSDEKHKSKIKEDELDKQLLQISSPSNGAITLLTKLLDDIFHDHSCAVNGGITERRDVASELEAYIRKEIADISVRLHGSSLSGFALQSSNVNINFIIPELDLHENRIPDVMKTVKKILEREKKVYSNIKEDYFAFNKIPRLLFQHRKRNLICEIRVNVGAPSSLAQLLQVYQSIDNRVLQLGVLFRYWAKVCLVDSQEDGHYPAHMFIIMVIHFLQQRKPPVIPVLHEMSVLSKLRESDQPSIGNSEFITEDIIQQVLSDLATWKSPNSESLGQLWLGLLKYYTTDFQVSKHAVSILQSEPILREKKEFGSIRLAVEDPMIPKSNLARAGSSDKVFLYLWTCMKQSTIYFYGIAQKLLEFETSSSENVPSNISDISLSATSGTQIPLVDEDSLSGYCHVDPIQSDSEHLHSSLDKDKPDCGQETSIKGEEFSKVRNVSKSKGKDIDSKNAFSKKDLVFLRHRPVTCLGCKKLNHNILNCPSEKLPTWNLKRVSIPPTAAMKSIKDVFKKYLKSIRPFECEINRRNEICDMILRHIQIIFPGATLKLFGSSANGFSSIYSDLDICLSLPEFPSDKMDKSNRNEIIEKLAVELRKHREYRSIVTISSARVPIIKFRLPDFDSQECDVSLENRLALRNTKMIAAYADLDERVRLLGYAVKYFAKECDMGDASAGSLSSYAYLLLMIHYLQRTDPPVVPCLQKIPKSPPKGPLIDGWNCYYYEKSGHSLVSVWPHFRRNQEPVGQLWLGFLRYYLEFDWSKEVVTIRQLEPLLKLDKWWLKLMCIEDPFNLDHNLAASITSQMRRYILERFYTALIHHSKNTIWKNIKKMMDSSILVGNERSPKFLLCHSCGTRGHRAINCPNKEQEKEPRNSSQGHTSKVQATQEYKSNEGFPLSAIPMKINDPVMTKQSLLPPPSASAMPHQMSPPLLNRQPVVSTSVPLLNHQLGSPQPWPLLHSPQLPSVGFPNQLTSQVQTMTLSENRPQSFLPSSQAAATLLPVTSTQSQFATSVSPSKPPLLLPTSQTVPQLHTNAYAALLPTMQPTLHASTPYYGGPLHPISSVHNRVLTNSSVPTSYYTPIYYAGSQNPTNMTPHNTRQQLSASLPQQCVQQPPVTQQHPLLQLNIASGHHSNTDGSRTSGQD